MSGKRYVATSAASLALAGAAAYGIWSITGWPRRFVFVLFAMSAAAGIGSAVLGGWPVIRDLWRATRGGIHLFGAPDYDTRLVALESELARMKRDAALKDAAHAAEIARLNTEISDLKEEQKRSQTPLPRAATALVLMVLSFVLVIAGTAVWAGNLDEPKPKQNVRAAQLSDERRPTQPAGLANTAGRLAVGRPQPSLWRRRGERDLPALLKRPSRRQAAWWR